jgi:hypothetical protein
MVLWPTFPTNVTDDIFYVYLSQLQKIYIAGSIAQLVGLLSSKCEALGSNPVKTKKLYKTTKCSAKLHVSYP